MVHLSAFTVQLCQHWSTMMADVAEMLVRVEQQQAHS